MEDLIALVAVVVFLFIAYRGIYWIIEDFREEAAWREQWKRDMRGGPEYEQAWRERYGQREE